ncbi:MAG TPA: helicase SNF2, partial [Flavisolibacter sp.]
MALPYLLKYVYTHGSDEVIRRGKKIHAIGFVDLVEHDDLFGSVVFRVKDDNYSTYYKVYISNYKDPKAVTLRCACPYNLGDICRHEAASLIRLQEMIDRGQLQSGDILYDQKHTVAKMKAIELRTIQLLSSHEMVDEAEKYLKEQKPVIESAKDETVKATVNIDGEDFSVIIRRNEERNFDTSSNYQDTEHLLCLPKVIVFLHLLYTKGQHYFETIRNWDKEKNKLLEAYGYSLKDDLKGKFEFNYKDGKPYLRVLDPSIKRIVAPMPLARPRVENITAVEEEEPAPREQQVSRRLGVVINFNKKSYPFFHIDLVEGEMDEEANISGNVQKLDLAKYVNIDSYSDEDKSLVTTVRKLQDSEINKYVSRNSPFSGIWENIIHHEDDELPEDTRKLILEYLFPKVKKLFTDAVHSPLYVLAKGKPFKTASLERMDLKSDLLVPQFNVTTNGKNYEVECNVRLGAVAHAINDNEVKSSLVFVYNHQLYSWLSAEAIETAEQFLPSGIMKVKSDEWPLVLSKILMPLAKQYKVDFDKSLVSEVKDGQPEVKLFLQEKGEYLVFQPIFNYKGYDTKSKDKDQLVVPNGDKVIIVHRNREAEMEFIEKLRTLHSNFISYDDGAALALKGAEVLRNNWFFLFVDAMNEAKTPVYGFESLKNFRFNTAKPTTHIYI